MKPFIRAIAAAGIALSPALAAQAADDMPEIKLSVVGNLGITTQYHELEAPFWNDVVPKATEGTVTATIKPWNELGLTGQEVYRLLGTGAYDVGTTVMGFLAGDAPITEGTDLPGLSITIADLRGITEAFRPALEKYYAEKHNIKVLGLWSYHRQLLYCRDALTSLQDLKGRKIRSGSASTSDFLAYFGATGIPLPFAEVQQALQTGVLDCAITGTLGGYKAKWHEVTNYLYELPISWATSIQGFNMESWMKLSPKQQEIITAEVRKLEQAIDDQNVREDELGVRCNTGGECSAGPAAGMKLVPVSADDLALKQKVLSEVVLPKWAERCGADCVQAWNASVGKIVGLEAPVK